MRELIIHFIGLALFSTAVPNEQGVRVLLPRVVHEHTTTAPDAATYESVDGEPIEDPYTREVEAHQTFIVYDESDFRREVGWPSLALPAHMIRSGTVNPARYRYVPLGDGERVSFHTYMSDTTKLSIPSLPKPSCGSAIDPANAAAIVHIPQGAMNTCAAVVSGSKRRYDTTLTLKRDDQYGLSIVATARDGTMKVLTVGGTKPVYVVNVPANVLKDPDYAPSGGAHYLAYYDLVSLDTTCGEQSFRSPSTATRTQCRVTDLVLTGDSEQLMFATVMDSNCSNSSWP